MGKGIHKEFLKFVGFNREEIDEHLPDWIKIANKLGLTEDDLTYAVREWLPKHWNVELLGIRKCIGAYVREIIDISKIHRYKESGVKIVYGILPAVSVNFRALKISGGEKIFVTFPDIHIVTVLGSFFRKSSLLIEKAEKHCLHMSCAHCGLNKTRLSTRMIDLIPSPDVIWSWGFNCNEAPKTDEFIQCFLDSDWNSVFSSIPHDTYLGEVEDENQERVEYLAAQIKHGQEQIERITGLKVEEQHLQHALEDTNRIIRKIYYLNNIVIKADPQPISGNELSLFGQMMTVPFNTGLKYIEEAIDITIDEVSELIKKKKGILPAGAPKIGCYFVPFFVPWVNTLFRKNGVNLSFSTFLTVGEKLLKNSKYQDPFFKIAELWLKMPGNANIEYDVELTFQIINQYQPDAMLLGFYSFDRWLGTHHKIMSEKIEKTKKIPHFYLEGDLWEDRVFRPEELETKIENICHYVKINKLMF